MLPVGLNYSSVQRVHAGHVLLLLKSISNNKNTLETRTLNRCLFSGEAMGWLFYIGLGMELNYEIYNK